MPAQAQGRDETGAVQEASRSGIRGTTVPVGIEPEDGSGRRRQAAEGPDRRVAIPAQNHWELSGSADGAYGDGETPHELKGSADLRWRLIGVGLDHLNARDVVSPVF